MTRLPESLFTPAHTMPEIRECIAHFILLCTLLPIFGWCSSRPWPLLELWVDPTKSEVATPGRHREKVRMAAGLPYRVTSHAPAYRGPRPRSVWPDHIPKTPTGLKSRMRLYGVEYSARALYLNLGWRWLSVRTSGLAWLMSS